MKICINKMNAKDGQLYKYYHGVKLMERDDNFLSNCFT